ncbi:hypothetical protein H6769_02560 [Candidatus Peribacteria bacterium]|nr:hypothetical protein [Candidatus Peribacteria bacterium]
MLRFFVACLPPWRVTFPDGCSHNVPTEMAATCAVLPATTPVLPETI